MTPGRPTTFHPKFGMTWKRALKLEKIARLTLDPAGYSIKQIAAQLRCTEATVVLIKQTPQFQAKCMELQSKALSPYDEQLRTGEDNMREELKSMVPHALNVVRDAVLGKLGSSLQFKASQEILDRQGTLARVSRTSVSVEQAPELGVDPSVAANLMALFSSAPPVGDVTTFTVIASTAQQGQSASPASNEPQVILDHLDATKATKQ